MLTPVSGWSWMPAGLIAPGGRDQPTGVGFAVPHVGAARDDEVGRDLWRQRVLVTRALQLLKGSGCLGRMLLGRTGRARLPSSLAGRGGTGVVHGDGVGDVPLHVERSFD